MTETREYKNKLAEEVGHKESRKIEARGTRDGTIWFGLGMFGIVGWSVAMPTIIGVAIGVWLDSTMESGVSWTLMLLGAGVFVGCLNAWYWVKKESGND